ncbi:MAG: hypothetical protein MI974_07205 [Chitinophagales bacterium]|nr:hypothetical protein [Chitinophagales bacterium]
MKDYYNIFYPKVKDFDIILAIEAKLEEIAARMDHRENFSEIPYYKQLIKLDQREMMKLQIMKMQIMAKYF